MSNFDECAKAINDKIAASEYARFGSFTEEACGIILATPQKHPVLASGINGAITPVMLCVTLLNESVFNLRQTPNTNGRPDDPTHWDMGPSQLNVKWTRAGVAKNLIPAFDERAVFGSLADPSAPFDGDPAANIYVCALTLASIHTTNWHALTFQSPEEMRCVRYTGPGAQPFRQASYREYAPLFSVFFECYQPD